MTYIYPLTKEHLTEDDIKVIKHLQAIDNLFKKGNLSVSEIFASPSGIHAIKRVDDRDYSVYSTIYVPSDGGDPDSYGDCGIYSQEELEEYYENDEPDF